MLFPHSSRYVCGLRCIAALVATVAIVGCASVSPVRNSEPADARSTAAKPPVAPTSNSDTSNSSIEAFPTVNAPSRSSAPAPLEAAAEEVKEIKKTAPGEQGVASWYGPRFHGRTTASGERFNTNDLTAAHKTLPFGTRVRVTSLVNGREVVVRINDRGPFIRGRIIDLSQAAAKAISMSGVKPVKLELLR